MHDNNQLCSSRNAKFSLAMKNVTMCGVMTMNPENLSEKYEILLQENLLLKERISFLE